MRDLFIGLSPKEIGEAFAKLDSLQQAEALKAAWDLMKSWGEDKADAQLAYIADDIAEEGMEMVERLRGFFPTRRIW